jgi:hypothetical protein
VRRQLGALLSGLLNPVSYVNAEDHLCPGLVHCVTITSQVPRPKNQDSKVKTGEPRPPKHGTHNPLKASKLNENICV